MYDRLGKRVEKDIACCAGLMGILPLVAMCISVLLVASAAGQTNPNWDLFDRRRKRPIVPKCTSQPEAKCPSSRRNRRCLFRRACRDDRTLGGLPSGAGRTSLTNKNPHDAILNRAA